MFWLFITYVAVALGLMYLVLERDEESHYSTFVIFQCVVWPLVVFFTLTFLIWNWRLVRKAFWY